MVKENEENADMRETELKVEFERGREIGRLEGMLVYQQRLIKNLSEDNRRVNDQLKSKSVK